MRQNEERLVDFIDPTEPNHRVNMHYSPRREKNDPEGDFKIIKADHQFYIHQFQRVRPLPPFQ